MVNPIGEDSWLAYLEEAARNVSDLEQRVNLVELHKRAISAEPASLRLWLAYCDYFWSLWASSQSDDGGWSDQEQMMGRELFPFGAALDLWQQGYQAIKYRLDDSHLLWNRWLSLELEQLAKTRTPEGVRRITHLYRDRLATPHLTWDDTSQAFSTFLSEYKSDAWEETMKEVTASSQAAKLANAARDPFELKLKEASRAGDAEAQKSVFRDYIEWEIRQNKGNSETPELASDLCCGLFDRALTGPLALDDHVWHEYIVFVSSPQVDLQTPERLLDILRRAVQHCPWSGQLWNRYILCAEEAKLPFSDIESIKHSATSENQLYKNGMESMIEMYVAWCGFLKRTALEATAIDEAVDVADVGLRAALEDVAVVGKRLYGKDFQGDPKFRLERIYIQYLTEKKGAIDQARAVWSKLAGVQIQADSYDFWFRYYMWEMLIFSSNVQTNRSPTPSTGAGSALRVPKIATAVLEAAASRKTIDWPEKVLEVYLQHCNDYELPASVRHATDMVHKVNKAVRRRRLREEEDKAAAYAAYYGIQQAEQQDDDSKSLNGSKRKRKSSPDPKNEDAEAASKRQKTGQGAIEAQPSGASQQDVKRDRENATIIVTGLPAEVTQTKVRQYFKEYGHINNITAFVREKDGRDTTALIEFRSPEEAHSALLRDGKYFGQAQISVQSGYDLTVYVANYPPAADDKYIRDLFKDCGDILSIRWPSLKVNTHRRFCYISFRDRDASAKAVAKEGTVLEGKYALLAKYSDPSRKKNREGAVSEGREVHVSGLDRSVTEDEIRGVFSKLGKVTRINIPQNLAGKNRGFAYLDFETKEQAQKAAEEMNNTKFRNEILVVEVSKEAKVKHAAKTMGLDREPASPAPSAPGKGDTDAMSEGGDERSNPSTADIAARTIALMGLPDTVNDARVRALVEPLGAVVQLVLQPGHGGAKIEFADAATAGKAALQLDSMEFEGSKLRTGTVRELRQARAEHKDDRIVYGSKEKKAAKDQGPAAADPTLAKTGLMLPPVSIRRPAPGRSGPKRGLGFVPRKAPAAPDESKPSENGAPAGGDDKTAPKSNADFKAMFLTSGGEAKKTADGEGDGGAQGAL
ncbi:RNA recognition motif domain-containing protein [Hirsutella rhossiliensis]|uniref:U4/U6 snRNA-associated-splicing factor PRP24 n=1 Tax=Hirsutella rhossiliensis TaxID=111463 RepID=A0A9P8N842_9HYPO|nr:RNA recognition motif domain-containing protein [Hirsutella rhossiliensis]KAH0967469.1 RNA recognition motif domain-containing protein [Hirsutella rhossiliensis]